MATRSARPAAPAPQVMGSRIQLGQREKSATSVRNCNKQPLSVESRTARTRSDETLSKELQKGALLALCLQPPAKTDSLLGFPHV